MARGTQLSSLVNRVKGEIGFNQSVGTASDLELKTLFQNKQAWLGSSFDWPFLKTRFNVAVGPGNRYVNVPVMNFERNVLVEVKWNTLWQDVDFGIGSQEFNYLDSDIGTVQDPVLRWDMAGQIAVPAPVTGPTVANSATVGSLGAGAYSYLVTYITPFGETSVGPVSGSTTPGINKSIDLSAIPVSPVVAVEGVTIVEVTGRNVYRTASGGSTYKFLTTINDNITTVLHDGAADSTLGATAPTTNSAEATAFEIWPLPASNQQLRFTGQRILNPLIADTDTADLDDMMLILYVAGEYLTRRKQADAGLKLQMADARMKEIRQNYPKRTREVVLGGRHSGPYNKVVPMKIIATA